MTVDYKQFQEFREKHKQKQTRDNVARLDAFVQTAVDAEHLVGHPYWNRYLSYIQTMITEANEQLVNFREALGSPDVVNQDQIMGLKIRIAMIEERKAALEYVIALPKKMMEAGEDAIDAMEKAKL